MQYEEFSPSHQSFPHYCNNLPGSAEYLYVGWIGAEQDFPTDVPDPQFISQLWNACRDSTFRIKSYFRCLQCQSEYGPLPAEFDNEEISLGDGFVVVEARPGVFLLAPNLIYHYVVAHHYSPPLEFKAGIMDGRVFPPIRFELMLNEQIDLLIRHGERKKLAGIQNADSSSKPGIWTILRKLWTHESR
ncbi:hypothetical protein [Schlesneria sp. DSM 10557]|uniref:DUF7919 family protein n=1 Tax=Schlesneria sp. DSM 10557 TaxID=3044399 RepID=UPI00359F78C4